MKLFQMTWKEWAVFVVAPLLAGILFAAQEKAVVDSPRLISFNAVPLYDDNDTLVSLTVTFTYRVPMLLPDGKSVRPHIRTEKADFVIQGGQLVLIGDQLVGYADLAEDILAVSDFVWRLNNPNALPTVPQAAEKRMAAEKLLREAEELEKRPPERRKQVPPEKRRARREPSP